MCVWMCYAADVAPMRLNNTAMNLSLLLACSCATRSLSEAPSSPEIADFTIGRWVNIHEKNPDLVGVYVQQFPDCPHDAARYEGKHPATVIYVFKNNKAHQMEYAPDGRVLSGFWWDVSADDWIWKRPDRNIPND